MNDAPPSTMDRLTKAYRQLECARDECTDQELRFALTKAVYDISVIMTDVALTNMAKRDRS